MARERTQLVIYQGETLDFTVQWLDEEGNPVDVTGYTARAQVRRDYNSPTAMLTLSSSPGEGEGTITLAAEGLITLSASPALTAAIPTSGVWDLELTNEEDAADVVRVAYGTVRLMREVTKA